MSDVSNAGNEIGAFLGGAFGPLLGTNQTVTTTEEKASASSNTWLYIGIGIVVVAVIGFIVFKPKKSATA